jgi:hypothetical protein
MEKAQGMNKTDTKQGFDRDLHIDKSIIDKVKTEADRDIDSIEEESHKKAVQSLQQSKSKTKEDESESSEDDNNEPDLYSDKPHHHSHKKQEQPKPVEQKIEKPVERPIEKPQVRMIPKQEPTSYASPESAKQMAVQKTLDLIKSFKKEETQEAL